MHSVLVLEVKGLKQGYIFKNRPFYITFVLFNTFPSRSEYIKKKSFQKKIYNHLYLPDTPNTSRRVLRGVRAKMALIFSPNNQNITCKDVLIT